MNKPGINTTVSGSLIVKNGMAKLITKKKPQTSGRGLESNPTIGSNVPATPKIASGSIKVKESQNRFRGGKKRETHHIGSGYCDKECLAIP